MVDVDCRSLFTVRAVLSWVGRMAIAGVLAVSFVVGPELANFAWDSGTHVTPAQALLHATLAAEGIHHHHAYRDTDPRAAAAAEEAIHSLDAGSSSFTFGSSFTPAMPALPQPCLQVLGCGLVTAHEQQLSSFTRNPETPPPKAP